MSNLITQYKHHTSPGRESYYIIRKKEQKKNDNCLCERVKIAWICQIFCHIIECSSPLSLLFHCITLKMICFFEMMAFCGRKKTKPKLLFLLQMPNHAVEFYTHASIINMKGICKGEIIVSHNWLDLALALVFFIDANLHIKCDLLASNVIFAHYIYSYCIVCCCSVFFLTLLIGIPLLSIAPRMQFQLEP